MKQAEIKQTPTRDLVARYNELRAKARRTPRAIRRNAMLGAPGALQVMLDEIQRRAMQGDNRLHELNH